MGNYSLPAGSVFKLIRLTLGAGKSVAISSDDYTAIVRAKRGLLVALALEEKFSVLLENYAEYEEELLRLALRDAVFGQHSWGTFQEARYGVNRRLVNLLSAVRLYRDHVNHELIGLYGRRGAVPALYQERLSAERNNTLAHRAMEAIRDHGQHQSFPIHALSVEIGSDRHSQPTVHARHSVHPFVTVAELSKASRFPRAVVRELEARGPRVQLTPMVREYVASIARVHVAIREAMSKDVSDWDVTLMAAVERAQQSFGDVNAIAAARIVETEDGDEEYDVEELFDDPIQRRLHLVARASRAQFVGRSYVTSQPKSD